LGGQREEIIKEEITNHEAMKKRLLWTKTLDDCRAMKKERIVC
jgi:hypothetical protein